MSGATTKRTALLIRCEFHEAARIRHAARQERRTISGYVLHAVFQRLVVQEKVRRSVLAQAGRGTGLTVKRPVKRNLETASGYQQSSAAKWASG